MTVTIQPQRTKSGPIDSRVDIDALKAACRGRWPEILTAVGGLAQEFVHFDKCEGPCPRCGGRTRFRGVDESAGALYCSHCHNGETDPKSGDGIAAIRWLRGWDFLTAATEVAQYVGNGPHNANGKPTSTVKAAAKSNGEASLLDKVQLVPADQEIAASFFSGWCSRKPPIKAEVVTAYGGRLALWPAKANIPGRHKAIVFRGRHVGQDDRTAALLLYRLDGKPFPAFKGLQERKTHLVGGSEESWFWPGTSDELKAAEGLLVCEGLTDALAATSAGLLEGILAVTNACGAKSTKLDYSIGTDKTVIVCGDADNPGQEGAFAKAVRFYQAGARDVWLASLPYRVTENHGKDLRDYFAEGGSLTELLDRSRKITEADLPRKKPAKKPAASTALVLTPGAKVYAGDRGNIGEIIEDRGANCLVHFVSPEGYTADKELPKSQLRSLDGKRLDGSGVILEVMPATELVAQHPRLRPPVIDGLARKGETINIVSVSKIGKSWLAYSLLLSIATGRRWLGAYDCDQGRALLIDNELHPETLARRLSAAADAMKIPAADWQGSIDILSLRGRLIDLHSLGDTIHAIEKDKYRCVLADAWYRFLPPGVDENSNAQVAQLYNAVDQYAEHLGAVWVNIHHASKGDQSTKSVTDVGAGAGSQSRAADTHLILRPHEEENVVVMEAAIRSFPPAQPVALRWEYPLWVLAEGVDPRRLRKANGDKQKQQQADDDEGIRKITAALLQDRTATVSKLIRCTSMSRQRVQRLVGRMEESEHVVGSETVIGGNNCVEYRLAAPQNESEPPKDPQRSLGFDGDNNGG